MIQIKKIHSMKWVTPEKTFVGLVADTNTGINETIGTPYGETSIIWEWVKEFPVNQISEYVVPVEEETAFVS